MWTQKDFKEKENIKRRDRGKRLEERESDLSKEERGKKIKGSVDGKETSSSSSRFSSIFWTTV